MTKIRYCPECGHIGDVPPRKINCCPDGLTAAVHVPPAVAVQARTGFMAAITLRESLNMTGGGTG